MISIASRQSNKQISATSLGQSASGSHDLCDKKPKHLALQDELLQRTSGFSEESDLDATLQPLKAGLWGMTTSVIQQKGLPKDYFI